MNIRTIVTFTSWAHRINKLQQTIDSIYNQTKLPDKIILNLSEDEFPNKVIPNYLYNQKDIFEIYWVKENTKSYKKLIPTLKRFPNDYIISIDDDVIYPSDFIEKLVKDYEDNGCVNPITCGEYVWRRRCFSHHGSFTICQAKHFGSRIFDVYNEFILPNINKFSPIDDQVYTHVVHSNGYHYILGKQELEKYKWSHSTFSRDSLNISNPINLTNKINEIDKAIKLFIWNKYHINCDSIIDSMPFKQNNYLIGTCNKIDYPGSNYDKNSEETYHYTPIIQPTVLSEDRKKMYKNISNILNNIPLSNKYKRQIIKKH